MAQWTYAAPYREYQFRVTLTETVDAPNNRSSVAWVVEHYRHNYSYAGVMDRYLSINGSNVYAVNGTYDCTGQSHDSWWTVASGSTGWIAHAGDGTKTITISFYWSGLAGGWGPGTTANIWGWALTAIPRYAAYAGGTPTASLITDVGFSVNVQTDTTCDNLATSLDGAGWVYSTGDFTNKTVALGGNLTSGAVHTYKTSIRRKDSQLWLESGTINVTTLEQNNFAALLT